MDWEWFSISSINWELTIRILVQCVLFGMSAFFSGSETALFSLSRVAVSYTHLTLPTSDLV